MIYEKFVSSKILYTVLLVSVSFFLVSCTWFNSGVKRDESVATPNVEKEQEKVKEIYTNIGETAKSIGKSADSIDNYTSGIEVKNKTEDKPNLQSEIHGIKEETQSLRNDQASLKVSEQKLRDLEAQLQEQQKIINKYTQYSQDTEKKIVSLQEKIKELESSNAQLLKTMMTWIVVASIVGIGASLAIGFFLKTPAAFMVAGGCIITLGIAVAVSLYMQYIAWIALTVLGLGCIGTIVYVVINITTKDKAVSELVHTGEVVKTYLSPQDRNKIFGNKVEPGVAHQIQSNSTINLVKKARNIAKQHKQFGLADPV